MPNETVVQYNVWSSLDILMIYGPYEWKTFSAANTRGIVVFQI